MSSLKRPLTEEQKKYLLNTRPIYIEDEEIKLMKKFTVNDVATPEFDMINFLITTNIKLRLMDNTEDERYDPDFEFPLETLHGMTMNFWNDLSNDDSNKNNVYEIGDTKGKCFKFTYKKVEYAFSFRVMGEIPLGFQALKMYNETTIYYHDFTLLEEFIQYANKYYNRFYRKIEETSDTFNLYFNEVGYWERGGQRKKRRIENLYMDKGIKEGIIKKVKDFKSEETIARYERFGIPHKFVVLLHGLPGTGKTSLVKAVASELDMSISSLTFNDKLDDSNMRILMKRLVKNTILLIEDMDCLFKDRKKNDEFKNKLTLSGILNCLDGLSAADHMVVFITTNYKDNLYDEALIRPGRIDHFIEFEHIKKEQIIEMYKVFMENAYSEDKMKEFVNTYYSLGVKCTTALIQNYLFGYVDDPDAALENIDKIKEIKNETTMDKYSEVPMGIS